MLSNSAEKTKRLQRTNPEEEPEPRYYNWLIWMLRIVWIGIGFWLALKFGSRDFRHIILAAIGLGLLSLVILSQRWHTRAFHRRLTPAFIPPFPFQIPPIRKTVFWVDAPRKVKMGRVATVKVEMYMYTILPYLDFSDTVLKHVLGSTSHPSFSITVETPSFEFAPSTPLTLTSDERFPLVWRWILEPKSLGPKKILLRLDTEILRALGPDFTGTNCIEIDIEVVSELGLSIQTEYWLKRLGVLLGVVFTLPFLKPAFEELGKYILATFKTWFH